MASLWAVLNLKRRFGHPKLIHLNILNLNALNSKWASVPWIPPPKNFPWKIFIYGALHQKILFFVNFRVTAYKNVTGSFTLNFDATYLPHNPNTQNLTWCQQFDIQSLPKSGNPDSCIRKQVIQGCFIEKPSYTLKAIGPTIHFGYLGIDPIRESVSH